MTMTSILYVYLSLLLAKSWLHQGALFVILQTLHERAFSSSISHRRFQLAMSPYRATRIGGCREAMLVKRPQCRAPRDPR